MGTSKYRVAGGISQVLLVVYGLLAIIGGFSVYQIVTRGIVIPTPSPYDGLSFLGAYFKTLGLFYTVACIALLTFVILLAYPVTKTARKVHGSQVGDVAIGFGLLTFPLSLIYSVTLYNGSIYDVVRYDGGFVAIPFEQLNWLGSADSFAIFLNVLTGITIALFGASFIVNSKHFSMNRLWKTTGVLYLITATLFFSVLLDFFGAVTAVAAGIVGLACFKKDYTK